MSDEWSLYLPTPNEHILCRVTGPYLAEERTITSNIRPQEDLRYKDSIPLGTIKPADVPKVREILYGMDANAQASFFSSHDFVRRALEKMERAGILDTSLKQFRIALRWMKENYADGLDG